MSSIVNQVSKQETRIDLTPGEAFWQTEPLGLPPHLYISNKKEEKKEPIVPKGWNRSRTQAEIARVEDMRLKEYDDYIMMCMKQGCVKYGTFEKCEHNTIQLRNAMGPFTFSKS